MTFEVIGESIHTFASLFLFYNAVFRNYSLGISAKSQILLFITYCTQDWKRFGPYHYSLAYIGIKLTQPISTSGLILLLFCSKTRYNRENDSCLFGLTIIPAAILAFLFTRYSYIVGFFSDFSVFLKGVAAIPQMYLILTTKKTTSIIITYLFAMGIQDWTSKYNLLGMKAFTDLSVYFYLAVYTIFLFIFSLSDVRVCSVEEIEAERIFSITSDFTEQIPEEGSLTKEEKDNAHADWTEEVRSIWKQQICKITRIWKTRIRDTLFEEHKKTLIDG